MTKRKVNVLMVLMLVALIGIIVLQMVWMTNALRVRNELFDRSVNEALIATSKRVETMSDVFFVQDIILPQNRRRHSSPRPHFQYKSQNVIVNSDTVHYEYEIKHDDNEGGKNKIKIISSTSTDSLNQDVMVEYIHFDSVINDWEEKIDHNITLMFDQSMKNIDTTFILEQHNIKRRFGKKKERLKDVAGRMFYETMSMDRDQLPDTVVIRDVLQEELQERNIPIYFDLAVLYDQKKLLIGSDIDSIKLVSSSYSTDLFPNNIFNKNEKLLIQFPDRESFVLKALVVPASLSIVFCGFIILVFGLSIYYILNQKKVSEMKSDFINNMTHEFKTPLATISVAVDTIVNPKVLNNTEKIKHFLNVIKKENKRMNHQVETILQMARLDNKDFEFNFQVQNIHELIEKAVQRISIQIESKGGAVQIIKNAQNPVVTTDATHFLSLMNNLLDNANKYSPDKPQITVETKNNDRGVKIVIQDKGIGMTKQVQQKIFEKFYRETTGNIHNVKGFGLGLSYVKAVVDANKGEINVQSEPGKGSTFELFIPFTLVN